MTNIVQRKDNMAILKAKTKYGIVVGVPGEIEGASIFKGIPYAKPPVGELRFAAPVEPDSWEGELRCTEFAPMCVQETRPWPPKPGDEVVWKGSEDCLYLNVWTPAKSTEDNLPVLYWIHGGGFFCGNSYDPRYSGNGYNKNGCILVTVGFRTGTLGWFGLKELAERDPNGATGTYGYMDIIQGLKWVQENIREFGGDPNRVTIFGQSSGAMSVKALMASKPARGLFHRGISQSGGGTWDIDPIRPMEEKCRYTQQAMDILGWSFEDVMTMDAIKLCSELDKVLPQLHISQKSLAADKLFQPSIDGYIVEDEYGKILYQGDDGGVDFMIGTIRGEYNNFPFQVGDIKGYEEKFALAPGIALGRRYAELGKKPVYHYFFDHDLPGKNGYPRHASDIQFTFGSLDKVDRPWTDYDREISDSCINYWCAFAKTGNPNCEGRAEWPAFTSEHPVTMHFANDGIHADDLGSEEKVDDVAKFLLENPGIINKNYKETRGIN